MSSLSCFSGAGFERVLEFDQWLGNRKTPQNPLKTPQNHSHLAHKLSGDVPQVNDIHLPKRETIIGFCYCLYSSCLSSLGVFAAQSIVFSG